MISRHDEHGSYLGEVEEGPPDDLFGRRRRRGSVEHISGDDRQIDGVIGGDPHDLVQDLRVLRRAIAAPDAPADVPIGRMEDLHTHRSRS